MVDKRIAIDCDGVLYQFHSAFVYMANAYLGYDFDVERDWTSWMAVEKKMSAGDRKWMWDLGVDLGLFRYGHVEKGAIIGVRELHQMGHELLLVTHRTRRAVKDTIAWLNYVDLPFDQIHILSDNQPKSSIEADILIDDKPENLVDWANHGRMAIRFDQPWNRYITYAHHENAANIKLARGWKEVVDIVRETP